MSIMPGELTNALDYEDCLMPGVISLDGDPKDWPLKERPLAYIAGFYTANPAQGIANAAEWFQPLLDAGWVPVVPHVSFLLDMLCPQPPSVWYEFDKALLRRCDALFVRDDLRTTESTGVKDEIEEATRCNMPIFHSVVPAAERYRP